MDLKHREISRFSNSLATTTGDKRPSFERIVALVAQVN
jgi:hypothetical protein